MKTDKERVAAATAKLLIRCFFGKKSAFFCWNATDGRWNKKHGFPWLSSDV